MSEFGKILLVEFTKQSADVELIIDFTKNSFLDIIIFIHLSDFLGMREL